MKFNIYCRFTLEVLEENGCWVVYRIDIGKRIKEHEVIIPASLKEPQEIAIYLDDLFHELSGPSDSIEIIS